jgi:nucleotide-binding universal stress UspA family protein
MTGIRPQIVVGLDGSPESLTAAHWAAREARLRDAAGGRRRCWPVVVVCRGRH